MTLQRVGADTPYDEIAAIIAADGCVVVEDLATGLVAQAKAELDDYIEKTPFGPGNFAGEHAKNVEGLVGKSEAAHALMIHDTVMAMADRILLPNCVHYQLNYTGIMHLGPGTKAQDLHRDGNIYPFRHPCPPAIMAVMWAGSEFTAANGGTVVVPGSHLWEEERQPSAAEVVPAEMPAGSTIIYAHNIIHGGGANTTDKPRTAVSLNFSLGWLRQQENQFLTLPVEKAKELPEQLQRLIGYDFGAPFMGAVNGQNPHALLEEPGAEPGYRSDPELERAYRERVNWLKAEAVPPPPGVVPTD